MESSCKLTGIPVAKNVYHGNQSSYQYPYKAAQLCPEMLLPTAPGTAVSSGSEIISLLKPTDTTVFHAGQEPLSCSPLELHGMLT